jgi:hypothetical protein
VRSISDVSLPRLARSADGTWGTPDEEAPVRRLGVAQCPIASPVQSAWDDGAGDYAKEPSASDQSRFPEESLADARDQALLPVGWKAALRTDDLARLRMADLHASDQGLSVFIARSKTDQAGYGTTLGSPPRPWRRRWGEGSDESTLLDASAAWVGVAARSTPSCASATEAEHRERRSR